MKPSGHVWYRDDYDTIFEVDWSTVGGAIDMTSVTRQPRVWGKPPSGHVKNGVLFRLGIVTIHRQVIRVNATGYEIIAEGFSQYEDLVQMNFPCQEGPRDDFQFHLNNGMVEECELRASEGPRWADPAEAADAEAVWADLDAGGAAVGVTGSESNLFGFVDVWSD